MDVSKAITEKDGLKVGINEMSSLRNFKMFFRFCFLRLLYIVLYFAFKIHSLDLKYTLYFLEMYFFVLWYICFSFLELFKTKQ